MRKITMGKIATDLGVSIFSVYRALNNKKGVSEELRKRIKDHASVLGYVNRSIPVEDLKKRFIFFVNQKFFLAPSGQYYSEIFYFLSSECNQTNSLLQIAFLEPEDTIDKMQSVIASIHPDGIFFAGEIDHSIIEYIAKIDVTTVYIDYYAPQYSCNYVYIDNYHLSYSLARHLISKGHSAIGFVGDIYQSSAIADRYFGYAKAMSEARFPIDEAWYINLNPDQSNEVIELKSETLPTAYLCCSDAAAQRLYIAIAEKGLKIPEDISVISFNNTPLCEMLTPKLTSAGPQTDYFAKKAFNAMIECLNNQNTHIQIQLKTFLTERDSVLKMETDYS